MKHRLSQSPAKLKKTAYSPAVAYDFGEHRIIHVAGHIAIEEDGSVVAPGDAGGQAKFIFEQIKSRLAEFDAGLEDLVKITIYVTDIEEFPSVSAVRNSYLHTSLPAAAAVEVSALVHPECTVEIEAVAIARKP